MTRRLACYSASVWIRDFPFTPLQLLSPLSLTLYFFLSSLSSWMSSSGFNEVYGRRLSTVSGCNLHPGLCRRLLAWEKRVCHSQTRVFSFLIQKQDRLVKRLTVRMMSFGFGQCFRVWRDHLSLHVVRFFSVLFWIRFCFLDVWVQFIPAAVGGSGVLTPRMALNWNLQCFLYISDLRVSNLRDAPSRFCNYTFARGTLEIDLPFSQNGSRCHRLQFFS